MRPPEVAVVAVAALLVVAAAAVAESAAPLPVALRLERAVPHKGVALEELRRRDAARHRVSRRRLLGGVAGVVDFPVEGSANPYMVGLYFTQVKLGNPAKEFFVQIDTGSDILWVTCSPCTGCPTSSGLNIQLESFSPDSSSTSSRITCSDDRCTASLQTGETICQPSDSPSSPCGYTFTYGDGSGTSGYYVSDTMFFETVMGNEQTANSSASIVFGCSNSQSGDLTKADRAVDGIFGFGQHQLSVVSQLNSLGVSPKVFSHCLKGSDNGGGILVLGEIVEPGLVYTPLVPSQPHYNLNLESIAVNGQKLSIDSSLFTTSNTQGTIVDSGTTLAYLADGAYDPFVSAIAAAVSPSGWEVTVIKQEESTEGPLEMQIALPSMPSLYIISFLYQACLEIHKVGGHILDRIILHNFAWELLQKVINIYENFISSVESGNSPVSEKGILQILLDLRFIGDVLSGGKSSSTNTTEMQTKHDSLPSTITKTSFRRKQSQLQADSAVIEPINKLINRLSQRLDPIDWATYEPYLWENEKQSYKRYVVLFGFLVQLNHMYTGTVQKLPTKSNTDSNIMRCSQVPRFKYLPISAPAISSRSHKSSLQSLSSDSTSKNPWNSYSNGDRSTTPEFDDNASLVGAAPLLKSFVTQVGSKFGENTSRWGSMLSDGQVGKLSDILPGPAAGFFSSFTSGARYDS